MKKTLLITAILAGLVSATASAATVYEKDGTTMKVGGRVEARGLFGDDVDGSMEDKSRSRINFKGKTQISDELAGFGVMEYEIKAGDDEVSNRYLYAGISTQVGDFSYGRQDTANVQVSDMTDISSYHSGEQQYIGSASDKENNTFLYSGEFSHLSVQANYIANGDEADDDSSNDPEDAFGISLLYSMDSGVDLGAAYSNEDEENQATFAIGYTYEDFYLAASYAVGDVDDDTDFTSLEIAAQYKFTKAFRMIGIYSAAEEDDQDVTDYVAIEGQYRFNSSIRAILSYKMNNIDDANDEIIAGLRYNF
ncbi:porin [Psychromonas sp. PT13]|uniref:porin n=1 Tax=Psychromonas sp. PT13 TaxID=3439547 RepID=UPI003EBFBE8D